MFCFFIFFNSVFIYCFLVENFVVLRFQLMISIQVSVVTDSCLLLSSLRFQLRM